MNDNRIFGVVGVSWESGTVGKKFERILTPLQRRQLVRKLLAREKEQAEDALSPNNAPYWKRRELTQGEEFSVFDVEVRENETDPKFALLFRFKNGDEPLPQQITSSVNADGTPFSIFDAAGETLPTSNPKVTVHNSEGVFFRFDNKTLLSDENKAVLLRLDGLLRLAVDAYERSRSR